MILSMKEGLVVYNNDEPKTIKHIAMKEDEVHDEWSQWRD